MPDARPVVLNVAVPDTSPAVPSTLVPSSNVTVPVGMPVMGVLTVAVNVTLLPEVQGLGEVAVTVVVVEKSTSVKVTV